MPTVSIIVPAYNTEPYICRCIESITAQTFKDIEIIVVDQHSTDGTYEKLIKLKKLDSRIQIIQSTLKGLGVARNIGIAASSGKYIFFVDSDDYIESTMVDDFYRIAEAHNADMVISNFFIEEYEAGSTTEKKLDCFMEQSNSLSVAKQILKQMENATVWNKMYKRSFLLEKNIHFEKYIHFEDIPFTISAIACADKIAQLNNAYYHYLINRPKSITTLVTEKSMEDLIYAVQLTLEFFKKNNLYHEFESQLEIAITKTLLRLTKSLIWLKKDRPTNSECLIEYLTSIFPDWEEHTKDSCYVIALKKYHQLCSKVSKKDKSFENKKIVIFSASRGGTIMKEFLHRNHLSVDAFCDNAKEKQGNLIDGIQIMSPMKMISEYGTDTIVIIAADTKYHKEIREQLHELGFADKNIY